MEKNDKKFPDFVANKKSLGILHSVVGAVPPNYKWAIKLAGMSGTIEQGRREIKEVMDHARTHPEFIFEDEAIIMYSLLILSPFKAVFFFFPFFLRIPFCSTVKN